MASDIDVLLSNGIDELQLFGITFVVSLLVLFVFKRIVLRKLKKSEKQEGAKLDAVIEGLDGFLSKTIIFVLSLWFASFSLILPGSITRAAEIVLFTVVAWYALKFANIIIDKSIGYTKTKSVDTHVIDIFKFLIRIATTVIVVIWYFSLIGLEVTTFLAGLGIIGLAIAFALQNVIADLFAAVTIYLDRPFEIGDTIKTGGETGVVEKIGIKSTHLRTPTGNILVVSNRELSNSKIHNMKRMERRRVDMKIGVSTETKIDKLEQIPEMIKEIIENNESADFKEVYFTEMGDFAFAYQIKYYIKNSDYTTYMTTQQAINFAILRKFEEEDIVLPYPTSRVLVEGQK